MNPDNHASLEASKRLHDAGIVMETEAIWFPKGDNFNLYPCWVGKESYKEHIPAPTMAELWRELPEHTMLWKHKEVSGAFIDYPQSAYEYRQTNPADALIELLIWVRKEGKEEGNDRGNDRESI